MTILYISTILITVLSFIYYSIIEGEREALYFYTKMESGKLQDVNEHPLFTKQRGMFMILTILSLLFSYTFLNLYGVCLESLGIWLMFPYFHDGKYYSKREELKQGTYPLKWKAFHNGSAKNDFTWLQRQVMFYSGIILIVLGLILGILI